MKKHPDGIAWIHNLPEGGSLWQQLEEDSKLSERVAAAKLSVRRLQADVDAHRSRVLALIGKEWTAEEISRAKEGR